MKIKYASQISIGFFKSTTIDLFLFANNHEKRGDTAFKKISDLSTIKKTIGFCYNKEQKKIITSNKIDYKYISDYKEINKILDVELKECKKSKLNIIIDYSCMTKSWYYAIIQYFNNKNLHIENINTYFIYTPSKYSKPLAPKPNTEIEPLPGNYKVPTDKPKALIVCLGYEQNKAEGIIEHLDPKISYLLYSKPTLDKRFEKALEKNNSEILSLNKNIITFPIDNLLYLERELTSLYYLLKEEYSLIIAPLGPKPFTLMAMLMSIKYKDIDIWRVGSGSDINEYQREPIDYKTFIISSVTFEN